jgi:phage-related protein
VGSSQQLGKQPYSARDFTLHEGQMVLLHGFVKKTQKTPQGDLDLARKRKKEVKK